MTTVDLQPSSEPAAWRDKKRRLWLMGLIAPTALFVMLPLVWALNRLGWHAAAQVPLWIGPILLYVLLPILDLRFGPDGQNPPDEVMERLENDKYYRYCTYVYIPFQYLSVILGAYLFTATDLSWLGFHGGLGWAGKLGLALSVGVLGGVGINTAHEMGHKKDSLERWLSKITLAQTCYGHFYIEHNRGHHVRVATPEDPASARFGRPSGSSCRAACSAACVPRCGWKPNGCAGSARTRGTRSPTRPTTCSTPGRCQSCCGAC